MRSSRPLTTTTPIPYYFRSWVYVVTCTFPFMRIDGWIYSHIITNPVVFCFAWDESSTALELLARVAPLVALALASFLSAICVPSPDDGFIGAFRRLFRRFLERVRSCEESSLKATETQSETKSLLSQDKDTKNVMRDAYVFHFDYVHCPDASQCIPSTPLDPASPTVPAAQTPLAPTMKTTLSEVANGF
ncbi:hypothetical protein B0H19DRAFT_418237 [Mycena capillaripes]|nr:hypothetical protein B0H19DRAFT_418237 [Mycena capillaripes]